MTREEALEMLKYNSNVIHQTINGETDPKEVEALDMAIKALGQEPEWKKGKWIYKDDLKQYFCSECGYPSLTYDDVYIYGMDLPNFCEDCGTDMRGEQDD